MRLALKTAVLALAMLTGQAAQAAPVVVWHAYRGKENEALQKVAEAYNAKKTGTEIQLLQIPYDAFADKVTASIPRGKGPDLFIAAQDRLGDWAAGGLIEAVDFWLDDAGKQAFLPTTVEALTYDDAVYGLPIAFKSLALFYNPKLVKTPPATTDELIAVAKKLTDAKKGKYGLAYENASFFFHGAWLQGFGGRVFDKSGKPTLSEQAAIDSMTFARDLGKAQGVMPEEVTSTLVTTLFNKGQAAMVINGPWFMGEIDQRTSYKVAPLPTISAVNKKAAPFLSVEGVIMSAKTTDKKAAYEVMKALTSVEAGKVMATMGRQPSAQRAVYEDPAVKKDELLAAFRTQLDSSVPMPNTPAMRVVWAPATIAMNKVINGTAPTADIMKECQAEVEKLVKGAKK